MQMAEKKNRDQGDREAPIGSIKIDEYLKVLPSVLEPRVAPNVILQDIVGK
jgi:hypothetical protein